MFANIAPWICSFNLYFICGIVVLADYVRLMSNRPLTKFALLDKHFEWEFAESYQPSVIYTDMGVRIVNTHGTYHYSYMYLLEKLAYYTSHFIRFSNSL